MWFRRDLRLRDNPALLAAAGQLGAGSGTTGANDVLALYVLDPLLLGRAGERRRAYLSASLRALADSIESRGGTLAVFAGDPMDVVVRVATALGAGQVHCAADFGPYGAQRDEDVAAALATGGIRLVRTGSPYAVAPGRVRKSDGEPYRVFTPFRSAWLDHGWRQSAPEPGPIAWLTPPPGTVEIPAPGVPVPPAGEVAAWRRWHEFVDADLGEYHRLRDRSDLAATSRLSIALRWGELHPRSLLADLARVERSGPEVSDAVASFRSELAWREFFADALWHTPTSARTSLRAVMPDGAWRTGAAADDAFAAWAAGRTGYPFVDAGMRQLAETGWMHGRVRMVTASFLVKDLRVPWQRGARHFMRELLDGDLAANQHNWQWVAGTGLDAAPFFRIFNPVTQGERFDPDGDYVRRWVPELRGIPGVAVHQPWRLARVPTGYPPRIVDHAAERERTLAEHRRR